MGVTLTSTTWAVTQARHRAGHQGELVAVHDAVDGLQGHVGDLHHSF